MVRATKTFGLLALSLLSLWAATAPAAGAQGVLVGQQEGAVTDNVFAGESEGEPIHCEGSGVSYAATDSDGEATELTLAASYNDCYSITEGHEQDRPATIATNGCTYTLNRPQTAEGQMTGTVDLACPAEANLVISIFQFGSPTSHSFQVCTLIVEPFEGKGHALYANVSGEGEEKDRLTATLDLSEVPFLKEGLCGSAETSEGFALAAKVMLSGEDDQGLKEARDAWVAEDAEGFGAFRVGPTEEE